MEPRERGTLISRTTPSDEEKERIRAAYSAGEGIKQLAEEWHRKTDTIRAILVEGGVTIRPRGWRVGRSWTPDRRRAADRARADRKRRRGRAV
ncbi:helix-turn-helix domain-containing protein [Modestobacter sp. VKM Ac-2978]|uniref:helix-turn-helix domain-containing protein n=1 Tax=Modestobacter sp. VKM Ac-2978 TaxID=3004132 RepID=UPI003FA58C51